MPSATHRQTLPRGRRLQLPSEFSRVRNRGCRLVEGCLIFNWREAPTTRLGVVTSRKVGPAVTRNRARRLLRECFRKHRISFSKPVELVLVARRSIADFKLVDVEKDFLNAAIRAKLIQDEQ